MDDFNREFLAEWSVAEPCGRDWPAQVVTRLLSGPLPAVPLEVVDTAGGRAPAQADTDSGGVRYAAELPAGTTRHYRLRAVDGAAPGPSAALEPVGDGVRALGAAAGVELAADGALQAVRTAAGAWRAAGLVWQGVEPEASRLEVLARGPVVVRLRQTVRLAGGDAVRLTWTVDAVDAAVGLRLERDGAPAGAAEVLCLRLGAALPTPTSGYWRPHSPAPWRGPPGAVHKRQLYEVPAAGDELLLGPFYNWAPDAAAFWAGWGAGDELLYLGWVRPSRTRIPAGVRRATLRILPQEGRLDLELPLQAGQRELALALLSRSGTPVHADGGPCALDGLHARLHGVGLAALHDMQLGVDPGAGFPRLWVSPAELPEVRRRFRAWTWLHERFTAHADDELLDSQAAPDLRVAGGRRLGRDDAGAWLATGDEARARRALPALEAELETRVSDLLDYGPTTDGNLGIGLARAWRSLVLNLDLVLGSAAADDATRRRLLGRLALLAEVQCTDDAWPANESGIERGNDNFHPDVVSARGLAAALLDGHPRQTQWLAAAVDEMAAYLERYHLPSGMSRESATYQLASLAYALQLHAAAARRGRDELGRLPALKRSLRYLAATQTPVDGRCGHRMLPTVGHVTVHHWCQSLQAYFAWAAQATAATDPDFAAGMMAAWRRGGGFVVPLHDYFQHTIWSPPLLLMDPSLPAAGDDDLAASAVHEGFGAILRAHHGDGTEGYVSFKMGSCTGHFDQDEGSLTWYAFGQPVLADFGCQYNPNFHAHPWLHNRISIDHRADGPPRGGRLLEHDLGAGCDYLCGQVRVTSLFYHGEWPERDAAHDFRHAGDPEAIAPHTWRRQLLYVHELEVILLRDEVDGDLPTDWNLQVYADSARVEGSSVACRGSFGVDLDVHLLDPAEPRLGVGAFAHQGFDEPRLPAWWWRGARWTAPAGTTMSAMAEQALTLRAHAAPGRGYTAVLAARRPGEPPAQVQVAGAAVRVTTARGSAHMHTAADGRIQARVEVSP